MGALVSLKGQCVPSQCCEGLDGAHRFHSEMAHRVLTFCSEDEREKSRQGDPPAVQCSSGVLVFPPAVWGGWLSIPYPARWQWPLR